MHLNHPRGFTLIELLVVVAIISLLSSIILASLQHVRESARDVDRIAMLDAAQNALAAYHNDHGEYLVAIGSNMQNPPHSYDKPGPDGVCGTADDTAYENGWGTGGGELRYDNSASPGFLGELHEQGYLSRAKWMDPIVERHNYGSIWNCRYVVPCESTSDADENQIEQDCDPQSYLLHCNLEANTTLEENDAGTNDTLYEVYGGDKNWICPTGNYPS